jgi:hypothetical protein
MICLLILCVAALVGSSGCSSFIASMIYEPAVHEHKGHLKWKHCVEIMSEPDPEGSVDIVRCAIFLVVATPMLPLDLLFYVFGFPLWELLGLPFGHDVPWNKTIWSWWYVMFSTRKFRKPGEAEERARKMWGTENYGLGIEELRD